MHIRSATRQDRDAVREVHLSAFPDEERELVATLATDLLLDETTPSTVSLVADIDDVVVGHVAFSPLTLEHDENWRGYILAPLGVRPDFQGRRVGSTLIEHGVQQLSEAGARVLFVYGDPAYYGRFGFSADVAEPYTLPYTLQYPFGWQAMTLNETEPAASPVRIACVGPLRNPALW